MKKLLFAICLMSILLYSVPVLASEEQGEYSEHTFTIMDSDFSVEMPKEYDVITRELEKHAAEIEKYKINSTDLLGTMRSENRYLEAINTDTGNEIMITSVMNKNSINLWSYSQKAVSMISQTANSMQRSLQEGLQVEMYSAPNGNKFLRYIYGVGEPESIVYATVENGRNIEIGTYLYNGTLLQQSDIDAIKEVVDSFEVLTPLVSKNYVEPPNPVVVALAIAVGVVLLIVVVRVSLKKKREQEEQMRIRAKQREALRISLYDVEEEPKTEQQLAEEATAAAAQAEKDKRELDPEGTAGGQYAGGSSEKKPAPKGHMGNYRTRL